MDKQLGKLINNSVSSLVWSTTCDLINTSVTWNPVRRTVVDSIMASVVESVSIEINGIR